MPVYKLNQTGKENFSGFVPPDNIISSKEELPKEWIEKQFPQAPKIIRLGFEFEFMLYDEFGDRVNFIPNKLWEKYHITKEYYYGMFELNNFLYHIKYSKSIKYIYKQLLSICKDIMQKLNEFKKEINKYDLFPKFNLTPTSIQNGYVWNGMHIHIGFIQENKERFDLIKKSEPLIIYYKNIINPTNRSVFSHHIWGKYRDSEWDFKRKKRYQPIIYTKKNTIEFRCFDFEDVFNKKLIKLFTILIHKLYKKETMENTKESIKLFDKLIDISNDNYELKLKDIL